MSYKFSAFSIKQLDSCDARIQAVLKAAIKKIDFKVIRGHRGQLEQDRAYERGASPLRFPHSKHNRFPSHAVDIIPFKDGKFVGWKDLDAFAELSKVVLAEAKKQGVKMRWGGDWDQDGNWKEETWFDGPHYELL